MQMYKIDMTDESELTPEQWIGLVGCCAEGLSAEECARQLNTTRETAAFWYACVKEAFTRRQIISIKIGLSN